MKRTRYMTVYLNLDSDNLYAFPSLDKIGKQMIPLYDLQDILSVDPAKFNDVYGFV